MINPFRIVWELIEFGIQAIFVYILAIIIFIGITIIVYKNISIENVEYIEVPKIVYQKVVETVSAKEPECKRPSGCRVLEDGTIEY